MTNNEPRFYSDDSDPLRPLMLGDLARMMGMDVETEVPDATVDDTPQVS